MLGDRSTIEIRDESADGVIQHTLYVDGERRAMVELRKHDLQPRLHWMVYGALAWNEAKAMLEGLLELGLTADVLQQREAAKKKGKK